MKAITLTITLLLAVVFSVQSQFYFTANPNNPILKASEQEAWDDGGVFTANALCNTSTFYLFYSGWKGEFGGPTSIGLAESEDGFNFSKVNTNTALFSADGTGFDAFGVSNPAVTYFENEWTLYYAGIQSSSDFVPKAIGKATSTSAGGTYFREENPILEVGGQGEWDSHFIMPASVIYSNGTYFLYYWGADFYPNGNNYIGLATSPDGLTWAKYDDPSTTAPPFSESDPVLMTGPQGSWDESMLWGCSVHLTNEDFEMFYGGFSLSSGGAIGYASSTDGISWTKDESQNPIFEWTDDPYAVDNNHWAIEIPTVLYNESVAYMYYDYGPSLGEIGMAVSPVAQNIIYVPGEQPTIQQGIEAASDGDLVLVEEGTYYENIRFKGKAITVASEFIMDGDSSHIVNTIIDGSQPADPDSAACVMFVNGEDVTSELNGFTLTGGSGVMYMTYIVRAGGGIYAFNAGCKIVNNIITGNHVEDEDKAGAAGIACIQEQDGNNVIIKENYIGHNSALASGFSAFGGGMAIMSNCQIENNLIEHNTCTNTNGATDGGGIELEAFPGTNPVAIVHSNIIRNNELNSTTKSLGGGITLWGYNNSEITENLIENNLLNSDDYSRGGGVWIRESVNVLVEGNTLTGNICTSSEGSWGGGIFSYLSDMITINNNIIENNECTGTSSQAGGGGINLFRCGKQSITENVISNNKVVAHISAYSWGGGIMIDKATDTVLIQFNTIYDNAAGNTQNGNGGGISFYTTTDVPAYVESNLILNNYSDYRGGGFCARNHYQANIQNNLFMGNEGDRYGGAINFFETAGKRYREDIYHPVIVNNTFIGNTSDYGGAIYNRYDDEVPVIFNSLFCNNTAENSPDIHNYDWGIPLAVYNNLIDTSLIVTPWIGSSNINCNPEFQSDSLHLDYPSMCLNAGTASLSFGKFWFHSPDTDIDGETRPFEGTEPDIGADEAPWLYVGNWENRQNANKLAVFSYPNPFATSTTIEYELNQAGTVTLTIYNQFGKLVDSIERNQLAGKQQVVWTPKNLPDGIYYFRLVVGEKTDSGKLVLMR